MDDSLTLGERALLIEIYRDFNDRKIDRVLARMDPNVDWPNGMEGGRVLGHQAVRAYWTRQWAMISPRVDPLEFSKEDAGRIAIKVHQVVCDLTGKQLLDTTVRHTYSMRNGLIVRMDIG